MQRRFKVESAGYNYIYLVKPRQFGFTTDDCIDMLDDAAWTPGISCAIIAHERDSLGKIFEIIKRAFDNIPVEIRPVAKYDTRNEYKFQYRYDGVKLDSEIYVALDLRSSTVQKLHISESAYIKDRGRLKRGSKQAVPLGGRIIEESTANGMDEFYDDVMDAWTKQQNGTATPMDYHVIFYAWFENPEYTLPGTLPPLTEDDKQRYGDEAKIKAQYNLTDGQMLWRRWKINEMRSKAQGVGLNAIQQFMQEYPASLLEAFQSGVGNVFELERLMSMQETPALPLTVIYKALFDNPQMGAQEIEDAKKQYEAIRQLTLLGFRMWHIPEPGRHYTVGVDPSDGEGADFSCVDVWDKSPVDGRLRQCAQFYGKVRPDHLAEITKAVAQVYNHAFAGVENNMLSTILFLSKIYDNYYMQVEIDKKTQHRSMKLGWNTNTKTRDPMIDEFIILFEDNGLEINSGITMAEMKTFVKKDNGKREHADGKHDDSLISAMIALQMRKYEPAHGRVFYNKPAGL